MVKVNYEHNGSHFSSWCTRKSQLPQQEIPFSSLILIRLAHCRLTHDFVGSKRSHSFWLCQYKILKRFYGERKENKEHFSQLLPKILSWRLTQHIRRVGRQKIPDRQIHLMHTQKSAEMWKTQFYLFFHNQSHSFFLCFYSVFLTVSFLFW